MPLTACHIFNISCETVNHIVILSFAIKAYSTVPLSENRAPYRILHHFTAWA